MLCYHIGDTSTPGPVDGSAWMAQRRAKQEQEQNQHRIKEEERKSQEQQEKRQRRKSQMEALKAAMQEIKETEPPVTSPSSGGSKRMFFRGEGTGGVSGSISSSLPSPPIQILTRNSGNSNNKGDKPTTGPQQKSLLHGPSGHRNNDRGKGSEKGPGGLSRTSDGDKKKTPNNNLSYNFTVGPKPAEKPVGSIIQAAQDSSTVLRPPPKIVPNARTYSVTIGPAKEEKPRGELQPNGTVKFSRKSSLTCEKQSTDENPPGSSVKKDGSEGGMSMYDKGNESVDHADGIEVVSSSVSEKTEDNKNKEICENTNQVTEDQSCHPQSGLGQHEDDETSMTSGGSRRSSYSSSRGGRGRRNSKGGRGGRNRNNSHHTDHKNNDDSSVTSGRSQKGGRGGGGGRRRNSLPKKVGNAGGDDRSRGGRGRGRSPSRGSNAGRGRGRGRDNGRDDASKGGASRGGGRENRHDAKGTGRSSGRDGGSDAGRGRGGRKGGGRSHSRGGNRGGGGGGRPATAVQHSYEIGKP